MSTIRKPIPDLIYGTAFSFDQSAVLVEAALKAGFRGIDTAGSATAYREALVGEGIRTFLNGGSVGREDLYVWSSQSSCIFSTARSWCLIWGGKDRAQHSIRLSESSYS